MVAGLAQEPYDAGWGELITMVLEHPVGYARTKSVDCCGSQRR
jgi:hypothetical protein